ncbi:hypothetical protein BKA69DRAFT_1059377 [Paraphysoderma sedebokerense]|nr:hypothetical protein BKA69DRAFT_1059377 [Paraphysoderma sedebokerense]
MLSSAMPTPATPKPKAAPSVQKRTQKVQKPDYDKHNAEVQALTEKIDSLRKRLDEVKAKINGVSNIKGTYGDKRQELRSKLGDIKKQREESRKGRDELFTQLNKLNESIKKKTGDLKAIKDKFGFRSSRDIDNRIQTLERELESGTLKLIEEKKAINEISNLRKSRKIFETFDARQEEIDKDRQAVEEIRKQLDATKPDGNLNSSWEEIKTELDAIEKDQNSEYSKLKSFYDERNKLQSEIDELFKTRKAKHEDFRKAKEEHYAAVREERIRRQEEEKQRREQWEEGKRQAAAERERELAEVPAFADEIQVCKNLIGFLQQYTTTSTPSSTASVATTTSNLRQVDNSIPEGATVLGRKSDRDEEGYFMGATKKNKKTKTQSKQATTFKFPLSIMEDFWKIKVDVPVQVSDTEKTIDAIKEKQAWFQENQDRVTAENKARAEAKIQALLAGKQQKDESDVDAVEDVNVAAPETAEGSVEPEES